MTQSSDTAKEIFLGNFNCAQAVFAAFATQYGLPKETALKLAAQTVMGTAKMVLESGQHPAVLKDAVASPGGTTIAGLHELERGALRASLMNAVEAATLRSRELGNS